MARARGAPALGLNGTPNRRPQILCCEIVFNSPRQMYFTPHSPLQMFHTPSFSPTFCCGIEFKTLQMYQEPAPIHVVALVLQKRRSEGWESINLRPPGQQANLSEKTISPAKDGHCFDP